jgi:hypothetical protein
MYHITQLVSGVDLGAYEGNTPDEALDAMAQDQGYRDYDELLETTGESRDNHTLEVSPC